MTLFTIAKTIITSFFGKAATVRYPFEKKPFADIYRGQILNDIDLCIFCSICSKKCPTEALRVSREPKEWEIDSLRCISCNYCVEVCPKKCLSSKNQYSPSITARKDGITLRVPSAKA